MDTLIRAPRLITETRLLPMGDGARNPNGSKSSKQHSPTPSTGAAAVQLDVQELTRRLSELEAANNALRRQLEESASRLQSVQDDIEEKFEEARDDGFALGQRQGAERAAADRQELVDRFKSIVESATVSRDEIVKANADVIAEAVLAAVTRIVGQSANNKSMVRGAVAEATNNLGMSSVVRLRVARRDLALVEELVAELFGERPRCQVIADENVQLGGCIIEQEYGSLDARLETQMEALRRAVMEPFCGGGRD